VTSLLKLETSSQNILLLKNPDQLTALEHHISIFRLGITPFIISYILRCFSATYTAATSIAVLGCLCNARNKPQPMKNCFNIGYRGMTLKFSF